MYEIQRMTTRQRQAAQTGTYRKLIGIADEVVDSGQMVLAKTRKMRGKDLLADMAIEVIRKEIEHYCDLGRRVIDQARRRVLDWRAGFHRGESLFHLRTRDRSDQARQGANAPRVRPQGVPRRKRARPDHAIPIFDSAIC